MVTHIYETAKYTHLISHYTESVVTLEAQADRQTQTPMMC